MVKVYDVPLAARKVMVNLAVKATGGLVIAGLAAGLVHILNAGPGPAGPLSAASGILFYVIAALAGLTLAGVLVTYVILRLGGGAQRHHGTAADLVNRYNAGHDDRNPDA